MNYLVEQLCKKINQSTVINKPWPHIRIPNFLPLPLYEEMLQQHNDIEWDDRWEDESSWATIAEGKVWCPENLDTFEALASRPFFNAVCDKFGIGVLNYEAKQSFKLDNETHKLQVAHRDSSICMMTMQIFLQPESYTDGGTVLMSSETKVTEELPLEPNFCNIFLNTRFSWHSVKQRGYTRKSMVQRWTKI